MNDLEKLKIAYGVIRELEKLDDIKGLKNALTTVRNLIANIYVDAILSRGNNEE